MSDLHDEQFLLLILNARLIWMLFELFLCALIISCRFGSRMLWCKMLVYYGDVCVYGRWGGTFGPCFWSPWCKKQIALISDPKYETDYVYLLVNVFRLDVERWFVMVVFVWEMRKNIWSVFLITPWCKKQIALTSDPNYQPSTFYLDSSCCFPCVLYRKFSLVLEIIWCVDANVWSGLLWRSGRRSGWGGWSASAERWGRDPSRLSIPVCRDVASSHQF